MFDVDTFKIDLEASGVTVDLVVKPSMEDGEKLGEVKKGDKRLAVIKVDYMGFVRVQYEDGTWETLF